MTTYSNSDESYTIDKTDQTRDMSMYFGIRAFVTIGLLFGYFYTIKSDIDYVQFFITTVLLFTPFILDYYPRNHESENEKKVRNWGMLIPSLSTGAVFLYGIINGDSEFWSTNPHFLLKSICLLGGIIIVILAILDYNNFNRRSKFTQTFKTHATDYIEENASESVEARIKRIQADKKEGLKKIALESEKKSKSSRKKG